MKYTLGIDVGGKKIIAGLVQKGKILKKIKLPTQAKKGKQEVIKRIETAISLLLEGILKSQIKGIGLGIPGPLNPEKGFIFSSPNLPGWKNVPIKKIIEKKFKIKAKVDNDTNCIALAESRYFKNPFLICLTLGTGLGNGIIINREIFHGLGKAGEIGHMVVKFDGPKCSCGNQGCLEEFVSTRGIARIAKKQGLKILDPLEIQKQASKGNNKAKKVYQEAGRFLGIGLANIVNIFNPPLIVLGGGISKAEKLFLPSALKEMKKRAFKKQASEVRVVISKLQEDAGILGATMLFD